MKRFVFLCIFVFAVVAFANPNPGNTYVLNDFTVRALSSSMVFDQTKSFSIGLGYKQFGNENYLLGGFRFTNLYIVNTKLAGYFNVIVPIRYVYENDFWTGWWQKVWLDAWVYWSF